MMRYQILLALGWVLCAACGSGNTVSGIVDSRSFNAVDAVFCVVDSAASDANGIASQIGYFYLSSHDNACAELQALVRHVSASQMLFAVQLDDPNAVSQSAFAATGYMIADANTQATLVAGLGPRPMGFAQAKLLQWNDGACGLIETSEYTGQSGTFLVSNYQANNRVDVDFDVVWNGNQTMQGHFEAKYCPDVDSLWTLDIAQNNNISCLP